jgi:5'-3' exonuclease
LLSVCTSHRLPTRQLPTALMPTCWACRYINFFVSRVDMLRSHGVEPWVVFDGGRLPIKGDEESSRHRWAQQPGPA